MVDFPTAWYCPSCKQVAPGLPGCGYGDMHPMPKSAGALCGIPMVRVPLVPPDASVEEILSLLPNHDVREGHMARDPDDPDYQTVCFDPGGRWDTDRTVFVVSPRRTDPNGATT